MQQPSWAGLANTALVCVRGTAGVLGVVKGSVSHDINPVLGSVLVVLWFSVHCRLRSLQLPCCANLNLGNSRRGIVGDRYGIPSPHVSRFITASPFFVRLPAWLFCIRVFPDTLMAVKLDPAGITLATAGCFVQLIRWIVWAGQLRGSCRCTVTARYAVLVVSCCRSGSVSTS